MKICQNAPPGRAGMNGIRWSGAWGSLIKKRGVRIADAALSGAFGCPDYVGMKRAM
jgi:hypothetical protein